MYRLLKIFDSSISDFTKAIELEPNNYKNYWSRSYAKRVSKDLKGAVDHLTKVIEINPNHARCFLKEEIQNMI